MLDMNTIVTGIKLTKICSIKPDKDSAESKVVNLEVTFDNVTLGNVFDKAVSGAVIQWQNGPGRKNFDNWTKGQLVKINFNAPAKTTIDPLDVIIAGAKAEGLTVEEYLRKELEKRTK